MPQIQLLTILFLGRDFLEGVSEKLKKRYLRHGLARETGCPPGKFVGAILCEKGAKYICKKYQPMSACAVHAG